MRERKGTTHITEEMQDLLPTEEESMLVTDVSASLKELVAKGFTLPEFVDVPPDSPPLEGFEWLETGLSEKELYTLSFIHWLHFAKEYLANPDDWASAYHFIASHPIFWKRREYADGTWEWKRDHGHDGFWISVSRGDEGGVLLEHGPSRAPDYKMFYHDHNMDVWAPTFEEAYVKYAKNVHEKYTLDGYEREDQNA